MLSVHGQVVADPHRIHEMLVRAGRTTRLNVAAVNQLCDPGSSSTCSAGQPTAAYDARQFQFALKVLW